MVLPLRRDIFRILILFFAALSQQPRSVEAANLPKRGVKRMEKDRLAQLSPEDVKILDEAEAKLSQKCGKEIAVVAYDAK